MRRPHACVAGPLWRWEGGTIRRKGPNPAEVARLLFPLLCRPIRAVEEKEGLLAAAPQPKCMWCLAMTTCILLIALVTLIAVVQWSAAAEWSGQSSSVQIASSIASASARRQGDEDGVDLGEGGGGRGVGASSAAGLFLPEGSAASDGQTIQDSAAVEPRTTEKTSWQGAGTWYRSDSQQATRRIEDPAKARIKAGWVGEEFAVTGSGGWYSGMYAGGFNGDFVMSREKYRKLARNAPVRVAKYKIQCLDPNPPRGCDLGAATGEKPRGRGWDRVGLVNPRFLASLPETDFVKNFPMFASCAVVGNGGSLLANELGAEIDSHDAIIRFNGGPVRGFERHVGSRTTMRLTNTQHMGFREFDDEVVLQHVTTEPSMVSVVALKRKNPSLRLFVTDGDFHQFVLDTMGDGAASNGFYGLVLADERCEKVTIYGFGRGWDKHGGAGGTGGHALYHYYDSVEPNTSQKGRDDRETPKLLQFVANRAHKFHFGSDWLGMSIDEIIQTIQSGKGLASEPADMNGGNTARL